MLVLLLLVSDSEARGGLRLGRYSEVLELKLTSNLASEGEKPEELQRLWLKPKLSLVS